MRSRTLGRKYRGFPTGCCSYTLTDLVIHYKAKHFQSLPRKNTLQYPSTLKSQKKICRCYSLLIIPKTPIFNHAIFAELCNFYTIIRSFLHTEEKEKNRKQISYFLSKAVFWETDANTPSHKPNVCLCLNTSLAEYA